MADVVVEPEAVRRGVVLANGDRNRAVLEAQRDLVLVGVLRADPPGENKTHPVFIEDGREFLESDTHGAGCGQESEVSFSQSGLGGRL